MGVDGGDHVSMYNDDPPWYRHHGGRHIQDRVLPGDEGQFIEKRIRYAQARDSFLSRDEEMVRDCTYVQLVYRSSCSVMRCGACPGPRCLDDFFDDLDTWAWWLRDRY